MSDLIKNIGDSEFELEVLKNNGLVLRYVRNQTEEICLEAVKKNGFDLQYVRNQTDVAFWGCFIG